VTNLNLFGNKSGARDGASTLADALKSNMTVTDIHLRSNEIGDEGASALADALITVNTSVTDI
jgi:hypothetical protein